MAHVSGVAGARKNDHGIPRIGLVRSGWHGDIVESCCNAFIASLEAHGVAPGAVDQFEVPGAFEIPLLCKLLARAGDHDVIVAAGFVVDGGIYRHEYVARAVIDALMALQLEIMTPIISAVLSPLRFHEHDTHSTFFREHMKVKGAEAACACLDTYRAISALPPRHPSAAPP